jgi:hypothetical protein
MKFKVTVYQVIETSVSDEIETDFVEDVLQLRDDLHEELSSMNSGVVILSESSTISISKG